MTTGDEPQSEEPVERRDESSPTGAFLRQPRPDEDDNVDDLVDGLFRDVDNRFSTLEAQYAAARQDLTTADVEETLARQDPIAASAARYELVSEVATLKADLERQSAELDERDRMLAELGNRIEGFEERLRDADEIERAAETTRQELHEERRELARVRALLEASAAEREELAEVAQRLSNEKEHVDTLLATAMERFEEVDRVRAELGEDLARIEAARQAEAHEHENRFDELTDAKTEARRLSELVDELTTTRDDAVQRADKAESKNERRSNEVNYLNRRIESLTERANESDALGAEAKRLSEENAVLNRRIGDLERELESQTAQAQASAAAVEAIADRSAQHDDLVARIAELEEAATRREAAPPVVESSSELSDLAQRARSLGAQRTSGAYEPLASQSAPPAPPQIPTVAAPPAPAPEAQAEPIPEVALPPAATAPVIPLPSDAPAAPAVEIAERVPEIPDHIPSVEMPEPSTPASGGYQAPALAVPGAVPGEEPAAEPAPTAAPSISIPEVSAPQVSAPQVSVPEPAAEPVAEFAPEIAAAAAAASEPVAATSADAKAVFEDGPRRSRMVLPREMEPDTPEAVQHLLSQPSVTAIVDARSFCGRTGVRPSELFERIEALRDRFDVPIEVVVTPVSTPVGGAPQLAAIGVHHVTGADTVSDRVRALCLGFPPDQPIVVIAGDDHVRRAAIGEEANVVDPAVVLTVT